VYCLSATSVDAERTFSKGRIVLSHLRNGLSVQSTRAVLCLGEWCKLGLMEDGDVRKAVKSPETIEELEEEAELAEGWDRITLDTNN
jgi:hypothetical protein